MATVTKVLKCILNFDNFCMVWLTLLCDGLLGLLTVSRLSVGCGAFGRGGTRCKDGSLTSFFLKSFQMYFCLESESKCTVNAESTNV